jgi:hypothetical protein
MSDLFRTHTNRKKIKGINWGLLCDEGFLEKQGRQNVKPLVFKDQFVTVLKYQSFLLTFCQSCGSFGNMTFDNIIINERGGHITK